MSTVKFELDYLSPEDFRHEHASNPEFTLTCFTELSDDSHQLELQHSNSVPTGKLNFGLAFLCILTSVFSLMSDI